MNIWKGRLLSEVPIGHVLIVRGKVKPNPNKICLELAETPSVGDAPSGIVLLKIETNFRENHIVRSMYQPGKGWTQEEISKNWKQETPKNPLEPGKPFNFRISILQNAFEIYVNDQMYATFDHMECPNKMKYIICTGDFEKITQFHHRCLNPIEFPMLNFLSREKEAFHSDVPKKYEIGTIVTLVGLCHGPSNSEFSIQFICSGSSRVFLKFLVKFDIKTVVRTYQRGNEPKGAHCPLCPEKFKTASRQSSHYIFDTEDEETCGEFPFKRGKNFKIAFGMGEHAIMIAVNGKFLTYYNYPFAPLDIATIKCFTNDPADLFVNEMEYHMDNSLLGRVEQLSAMVTDGK